MVKLVQVLLLIAGFFAVTHSWSIKTRNGSNHTSLLRHKNKVFYIETSLKLNWYGALHFCKLHNMELASVESLDEHNAIVDYTKAIDRATPYWIAGNNLESNDLKHFYWANTGQEMNFTMWDTLQPDNQGGIENCVHIFFWGSSNWNDEVCTELLGFICEMRI